MYIEPVRRNAELIVAETLLDTPVTVIQGARQVGKSTLAGMVAKDMISRSDIFPGFVAPVICYSGGR